MAIDQRRNLLDGSAALHEAQKHLMLLAMYDQCLIGEWACGLVFTIPRSEMPVASKHL